MKKLLAVVLITMTACFAFAASLHAQTDEVRHFDFEDKSLGATARVYLPGNDADWTLEMPYRDANKSITTPPDPQVFVKVVFQSSDGQVVGFIRTMEKIAPYDAAFVFDKLILAEAGVERTGVKQIENTDDGKAYIVEYLHPALNRRIGYGLAYNEEKAIQFGLNVPNDERYQDVYAKILTNVKLGLIVDAGPQPEPPPALNATNITGAPKVVSTSSFEMRGQRINLEGVEGVTGAFADQLARFIQEQGGDIACTAKASNVYRCHTKTKVDLSQAVLLNGSGKALPNSAPDLVAAEKRARDSRRGLWAN